MVTGMRSVRGLFPLLITGTLASGQILRGCIPLGLNVTEGFTSLIDRGRDNAVIGPAADIIEEEVRRNTFWLAYALERLSGCGNNWSMSLDDRDISQLLPVNVSNSMVGASPVSVPTLPY